MLRRLLMERDKDIAHLIARDKELDDYGMSLMDAKN